MRKRTFKKLWGGVLAGAIAIGGGGGVLALSATPAGASNKQVSIAGSFTTYQLMHALFPTSINDLLPGGTTAHQRVRATATYCAHVAGTNTYGIKFTNPTTPTTTSTGVAGAPNGSTAGKKYLLHEEGAGAKAANRQGCVDFTRSSSPPKPGAVVATHTSANFDYYAYALDGVAPMVGTNANTTAAQSVLNPVTISLTQMKDIYSCAGGATTWGAFGLGRAGTIGTPINRFWPQSGSGTRAVYSDMLGFTPATTLKACPTPPGKAVTHFTVGATSVPNEENTESGLIYATKVLGKTIKNDIYIYSSGKFVSQWNNPTDFSKTKANRITPVVTGNFTTTTLELASIQNRVTLAAAPFLTLTQTTVNGKRTVTVGGTEFKYLASINRTNVKESNEWYSHIPSTGDTPTASTSPVPGVRYVYNICDVALPGYNVCKALAGFDNQRVAQPGTQTTGDGTKSRLCSASYTTVIIAQGFVPLTKPTGPHATAPATSDLAHATCREFPGTHYPGHGGKMSWIFNTWVSPT